MAKSNVSTDFNKFLGANPQQVEEAKKAENNMSSTPTPVGWTGNCVLLEARADKGKDKKNADGTTREGSTYVLLKFGIVNDEKFQGKTFNILNAFFDSKNATKFDRYAWFLNFLEQLGLPREMREEQGDQIGVLLDYLLDSEAVFDVECVADDYADDKKAMKVRAGEESVDDSTSMTPSQETNTPSGELEEGSTVEFLGSEWKVLAIDGEHVQIEKNGRNKTVTRQQLNL